jgi:hypothetical protein
MPNHNHCHHQIFQVKIKAIRRKGRATRRIARRMRRKMGARMNNGIHRPKLCILKYIK